MIYRQQQKIQFINKLKENRKKYNIKMIFKPNQKKKEIKKKEAYHLKKCIYIFSYCIEMKWKKDL